MYGSMWCVASVTRCAPVPYQALSIHNFIGVCVCVISLSRRILYAQLPVKLSWHLQ